MEDTKILNEILKKITSLGEDVGVLKDDMSVLKEDVSTLKEDMAFMKDNAVSIDEFNDFKQEVRGEFVKVREEIISHVDGFVNLHKNLDTEQASLRSKVNRHEVIIQRMVKHVALPVEN